MKKSNNISRFLSLAAIALFSVVSCELLEDQANEPVFPECVTENDIEPGTEISLTFEPNMDWTVSIPEESFKWFKIKDGNFELPSLSGTAADSPVTVTIVTDSEESFAIRSCNVILSMGDRSEVIATYMLKAKDRVIEAYTVAVADGKFVTEGGEYVYSETPLTDTDVIELVWDDNERRFYFPVKIKANFEWEVEWPAWARADFSAETRVGELCFDIYGVPANLPMQAESGKINFKSGQELMKAFNVNIPSAKDKFSFNLSGYTSLAFDHACYFHSESGAYSKDPVQGSFFGPAASRTIVLELTDNGYVKPEIPWLNLAVTAWDSVTGAAALQTREVSITVPRYAESTDRHAVLLFLPATAPENIDDLLVSGNPDQIKEEYSDYAVEVVQTGRPSEYITFEEAESVISDAGIIFEKAAEALLPGNNFKYAAGAESWQYNLSYTRDVSLSKSAIYLTEPYYKTEIYDASGVEITEDLTEHWLSYNSLGEGLYGQIMMDKEKFKSETDAIDGYVVFKNDEGLVLCAVHCFYEAEEKTPEDVYEDVSELIFVDPAAAAQAGATVHKVISGPTYEEWVENTTSIYKLKFTVDNSSVDLNTSKSVFNYICNGKWAGPEMVIVDETEFNGPDENAIGYSGFMLEWDPVKNQYKGTYDGVTSIRMKMPEGNDGKSMTEVIQFFDKNNTMLMIFICELSLAQ